VMESIIETKGWVLFPDALLNCRTWRPTHGSGIVTLMQYHKVWRNKPRTPAPSGGDSA